MNARQRHILLWWLALLGLLAIELGASYLPIDRAMRPMLLFIAAGMVTVVALVFMRLATSPNLAKIFAAAGLFWLVILLGLGSVDPMTRMIVPVQHQTIP
jgi:cytochrome c oxidase subunit IV